jgi:deoxyribonuclease-2
MLSRIFISFFLISALSLSFAQLSCIDRQGNSVAWFTFIKFPGELTNADPRFAYLDSESGDQYQVIQGAHHYFKDEALERTISAINVMPETSMNKLVWNDQPPNKLFNPKGGHAKGIIGFDNATQTGVYIMHSFPKFPDVLENGQINSTTPPNTVTYGQNCYCISIDKEMLGNILHNLPVKEPNVYHATGLFDGKAFTSNQDYLISQFHLLNGDDQWFLSKNARYAGFLYEDIVQPYFKVNLAVESWGRPYQPPRCPPVGSYGSLNIARIAFNEKDAWDHTQDHSKWAVSVGESGIQIACLCDVNRMDSQGIRGGSCLCSKNKNLHRALSSIVKVTDQCSGIPGLSKIMV